MVDPESGKTQMTLTTERPSTPRLYIGRTRESDPSCSPCSGQPPLWLCQAWQLLSTLSSSQSITLSVNKLVTEH